MPTDPQTQSIPDSSHTVYVGPGTFGAKSLERVHFLVVEAGQDQGLRILLDDKPKRLGREEPCEIVLPDSGISRSHCRFERRFDEIVITDLGSTNGSFVDGRKVQGTMMFPVGSSLQVGRHVLRHEIGTRKDFEDSLQLDQELQEARRYVQALLPEPWRDGPVRTDWLVLPSAKLGGDALGYHALDDQRYAFYLVDVSGHGARAAMHGVSVINTLRHHALPGTDFGKPEEVLCRLNDMFDMEKHGEMYFTIWYGVFDRSSRIMTYASGGHHPAFLVPPARNDASRMQTRNIPIGTMPGYGFSAATADIPPGGALYLFSDGVFELVRPDGSETGLGDFVEFLAQPRVPGLSETSRLHLASIGMSGRSDFDDDYSILVAEFD
jgi:hypothetical protein